MYFSTLRYFPLFMSTKNMPLFPFGIANINTFRLTSSYFS